MIGDYTPPRCDGNLECPCFACSWGWSASGCENWRTTCPVYDPGMCWIGMDPDCAPLSDWCDVGCDIGCRPCFDTPDDLLQDGQTIHPHGPRFLVPDVVPPNRDAKGRLADLGDGPQRVPRQIHYLRAPCFDNFGAECFINSCDCYPGPKAGFVSPERCARGEAPFERLIGLRPDMTTFTGSTLLENIECRRVTDHGARPVALEGTHLFQAMFHRTSGCAPNVLIPCTATTKGSFCPSGWLNSSPVCIGNPEACSHYNMTPQRGPVWDECWITDNTTHLRGPTVEDEETDEQAAVRAAKDAVLAAIRTQTFGTERMNRLAGRADQGFTGQWRRDYDGGSLNRESLNIAYTYPRSRLYHSDCPIQIHLRVRRITFEVGLILQREQMRLPTRFADIVPVELVPYARVRIRVECATTVDYQDCPRDPNDRPVAIDENGRISTPPMIVEWWGMRGAFSLPRSGPLSPQVGANSDKCVRAASALDGFIIPGWPYAADSQPDDPNTIYGGQVTIRFPYA